MIDSRKNLCYIVTVHYLVENGAGFLKERRREFISLHSVSTKICHDFAIRKAKEDKQFKMFADDWISQRTVPNTDYCK